MAAIVMAAHQVQGYSAWREVWTARRASARRTVTSAPGC